FLGSLEGFADQEIKNIHKVVEVSRLGNVCCQIGEPSFALKFRGKSIGIPVVRTRPTGRGSQLVDPASNSLYHFLCAPDLPCGRWYQ
ncbi:MAG TPA: hypothetical protein VN807_03995, partial [Candidatus Sulfotelmatobacter sp.]|nr:hypothetical protein [Candidatus Sulfotelmatobacter sp.]